MAQNSLPNLHQGRTRMIMDAAEYAYEQAFAQGLVLDIEPESLHRQQVCSTVSNLMLEYLVNNRHPDAVHVSRSGDIAPKVHSYVLLDADHGKDPRKGLVADGTWQQFFEPEDMPDLPPDVPRVLVGSRADVVAFLGGLGAPETVKDIYRPLPLAKSVIKERLHLPRR